MRNFGIGLMLGFVLAMAGGVEAAQEGTTNSAPAAAGQSVQQQVAPGIPVLDSTRLLIDFQKSLSDEAKQHEDFLEKLTDRHQALIERYYLITTSVIAGLATIFTGLVSFFGFKTFKQIDSVVTKRITEKADQQIAEATSKVQQQVTSFEQQVSGFSAQVASVAQRQDEQQRESERHAQIKRRLDMANFAIASSPSDLSYKAHLTQAVATASKCIEEDPVHAPSSAVKGLALIRLERIDEAIAELERCLKARKDAGMERGSQDGNLFYNLACYQSMRAKKLAEGGKTEEAERQWAEAWENLKQDVLKLNPEDWEAAKVDRQLESIVSPKRQWEMIKPKDKGSGSPEVIR